MEKRRITTVKTKIKPITSGQFFKQEGFEPNYVLTNYGQRLSRIRVLATVADKFLSGTGKFAAITIDDGTDTIRVKVFNAVSMFENIGAGDIIDIIGRVKEYNGEIYLAPEIIAKVEPDFELLRELEIRNQENELRKKRELVFSYRNQVSDLSELSRMMKERFGLEEADTESILQTAGREEEKPEVDVKDTVLRLIEKLDSGNGCDYSDLLNTSNLAEEMVDSVVNELLSEGTCFEPRPGKIKKL